MVENYTEHERLALAYVFGPQHEYLSTVLNWGDIWARDGFDSGRSLTHLFGDERLESVIANRRSSFAVILNGARPLQQASERIISLLARNLAEG